MVPPTDGAVKVDFETDVCIIGGGIAGNYLAFLLRKTPIDCVVIEKTPDFMSRPLQCAGIVSQKTQKIANFPDHLILNRVKVAEIISPQGDILPMSGKESPLVIDRLKFDAFFGEEAIKSGARYYFGEKYLKHWALGNGMALIRTDKHYFRAKIIVGADGPFSAVAKRVGIRHDYIPAIQGRYRFKYNTNKTGMVFLPELKELFGYIVPEGENGICRIGGATRTRPKEAFGLLLKFLGVESSMLVSSQGGVIPFGFPSHIAHQNTVLLGDAACMVKASTGGGIVMLMSAAKILNRAITLSLKHSNFSRRFLNLHYQRPFRRKLGIELKIHYTIRLILLTLEPDDYRHFFNLYHNTRLKLIIQNYADMDFPLHLVGKLLLEPQFLAFCFQLLFRKIKIIPKVIRALVL